MLTQQPFLVIGKRQKLAIAARGTDIKQKFICRDVYAQAMGRDELFQRRSASLGDTPDV
jgi:hypothetical protein